MKTTAIYATSPKYHATKEDAWARCNTVGCKVWVKNPDAPEDTPNYATGDIPGHRKLEYSQIADERGYPISSDTVSTYTGNGQLNTKELPTLVILADYINDVALAHVEKNTGLHFTKRVGLYEAKPLQHWQITTLLLTWNLKTQYHDNASSKNTLYLKFCRNDGFKVDVITKDTAELNYVRWGLDDDARLMV